MLNFDFDSLSAITDEADLIIRGRPVAIYVGEHRRLDDDEQPVAIGYVTFAIDEVLKGNPIARSEGNVEVQFGLGEGPKWDEINEAGLPPHEDLVFLKYEPDYNEQWNRPQATSDIAPFAYFLPNHDQSVIRNIDGHINVIAAEDMARAYGSDIFPVPLNGLPFADVLEQVRSLAQSDAVH